MVQTVNKIENKKDILFRQLATTEHIAVSPKLSRLLLNPYKYISTIVFRKIIYPLNKKVLLKTADIFFGKQMQVALPSSTDIYLTGGKSDNSEIRLARFLIRNLNDADHVLDIGAHFGYFTLLASELIGMDGKIVSVEPAHNNHMILLKNCSGQANITVINKAMSDHIGTLTFYEFPMLYSEYNSMHIEQFVSEPWFQTSKPQKTEVLTGTIDELTNDGTFQPKIIKIDVEGAECDVIKGALQFISNYSPLISMEYLAASRHNVEHKKAVSLLREQHYHTHIIAEDGSISIVNDIDSHLAKHNLESDNIVFVKKNYF